MGKAVISRQTFEKQREFNKSMQLGQKTVLKNCKAKIWAYDNMSAKNTLAIVPRLENSLYSHFYTEE